MKSKTWNRRSHGFTLVEVMAVIVIIGLLAAVAARNFIGRIEVGKVTTTKASLKVLHQAVVDFKMDTGRYPTEEAGLIELIEKPTDVEGWAPDGYLESTTLPKDGWKNDFVYQLNPESGKPFVIISYGADGKEGGEGYDADLYSTDTN
ncbi:type II secretion system major pseudopilin GspG [Anaerohalosphaeraceae bacterium U12dextr]